LGTLREQQLKTLELRNTAMAVTIDIGNPENVHPTDKVDVRPSPGLAARALSYGEAIEYSARSIARQRRKVPQCGSGSTCQELEGKGAEVTV